MESAKKDQVIRFGITAALVLTLGFSALAFSYLRNPASDDPWTYRENVDRGPAEALDDIGSALTGSKSRFVKTVGPEGRTDSHQLHFESQGQPLVVRVMPDPADPLRGRLVWDTPGGPRTICRGLRPGGFRVMEIAEGWILKLEVVRMDRNGQPTDLVATKTVKKWTKK